MSCTAPCERAQLLNQEAFTRFSSEWDALLSRSYDNRLFFTSDWLRIWWEHFGSGEPAIYTVRADAGDFDAILPLQTSVKAGKRVVTLAGDYNVTDYMDGLARRDHAHALLAQLWSCALQEIEPDTVELRHVPASSALIPAIEEAAGNHGLRVTVEEDAIAPVAILCSTWDGYLQTLTKKQRHEIRRKLRRAQEGVEWAWVTAATHEDLEKMLPTFFRLHELSGGEKARFMTTEMRSFFITVARHLLDRDQLRLSIFRRDGIDVAATMSFFYADRFLLYNSGYDPEYASHSPGIAAVAHAMQDAIEVGASAFDFLSGDEPYKYQMGAQNTYTCRINASR